MAKMDREKERKEDIKMMAAYAKMLDQ